MTGGTLYGIGVGPGDPELLTLKAVRLVQSCPVVAYPAAEQRPSIARGIVSPHLHEGQIELPFRFPISESAMPLQKFYDEVAEQLSEHLAAGRDVAVLCEGDPMLYGTFMYLHDRLADRYRTEVVPGVSSITASASVLGLPLAYRNDVLSIIPAGLPAETIRERLRDCDSALIIKVGRYFEKVREILRELDLARRAQYVERATMTSQRTMPLDEIDPKSVPYVSMIVVPSAWRPS